ncbi:aminotransferase class V-fold PLP-dependent enzyme [Bradyrhizobium sp. C-145]|uniref:aminotransferase class V-fold PLP-dependent enzyme n=1 Tax=Bradyrhizobium sp. C-145 TaxID=574727 RepID=UPI00201B852C|nr:aminotransferase class V-fold PLP-dependent enzyme [Bradyrhizobium sp. C-145]UQR61208.1 aminotransferase class V-fold PLP-dependent enzyme [Bradyrhizobium sp. C-145]
MQPSFSQPTGCSEFADLSDSDVDRLREDTPGVANRLHFNNAGAALMPKQVVGGMIEYLQREAEIGGYEASAENTARLDGVYDSIARLVGSRREEIALAENATLAWQRAFYSLSFGPEDRILTTSAEFAANYVALLQVARRTGARVEVIPDDANRVLDPKALERMIDARVRLIAITWVPTNGGLVNPAEAVGRIARRHGIPYLLDACQAVGQMPIDVCALGCDMLTATGRKFLRGPRGTGFLYIRSDFLKCVEPAMIDLFGAPWVGPERYELRSDARRFETWESNYAARLGLGIAVDYALSIGIERIERRCRQLANGLRELLAAIAEVSIHDLGERPASIVSFTIRNVGAREVMRHLAAGKINVSVSPPTSTPLDATRRDLPDVVRASPHYYNTFQEVETLVSAVRRISS